MTEREKIIDILNKNFTQEVECTPVYTTADGKEIELPQELCDIFNDIVTQAVIPYFADALIAAGIGDVGETKEKLKKINERILLGDIIACDLSAKCAEYKYRAEVAERALKKLASFFAHNAKFLKDEREKERYQKTIFDDWINQAEEELAEEKR